MIYETLRSEIANRRPDIDLAEVDRAYEYAKVAHLGQKRYSGEDYIVHPIEAARILLDLDPDLAAIQACLMHDVSEDTPITVEQIKKEFGEDVGNLVSAMEKMAVIKVKKEDQQTENWKKMFLAMAKDIRVVFIKLSDRLHNMRTLQFVPKEKQERIARETLFVHAAIASRLGIYQVKSELEDLCFKYLCGDQYLELKESVAKFSKKSDSSMEFATSKIEQMLMREGVQVQEVSGRKKHLWSIYQKMEKKQAMDISEIYDLFAVRVILPDSYKDGKEQVAHLYSTLGIIHNNFIPLQDRFKDYIAVAKPNGYRSLHTTVLGIYDAPTEIQIRTASMHAEAELGVASHWAYKEKVKTGTQTLKLQEAFHEVRALLQREPDIEGIVREWIEKFQQMVFSDRKKVQEMLLEKGIDQVHLDNIKKARAFGPLVLAGNYEKHRVWLKGLADDIGKASEIDIFPDKIFVLSPKGDVVELARGASPLDFAYLIHSDVGNHCNGAKVNGKGVPLDYELKNGEIVEIVTRTNAKPGKYWLSIAKTSNARAKIKNWFHKQEFESNVKLGREMLNHELELMHKPKLDEKFTVMKNYAGKERSLDDRIDILEAIGLGTVSAAHVAKTIFAVEEAHEEEKEIYFAPELTGKVLITGESNLPLVFSACCKPKPPNAIVGYVRRGSAISIHRKSCRELSGLDGERFVEAVWA
ncbi:MAG: HD domain-containing protein [Patescibacteria group bacterium]